MTPHYYLIMKAVIETTVDFVSNRKVAVVDIPLRDCSKGLPCAANEFSNSIKEQCVDDISSLAHCLNKFLLPSVYVSL